MTITAGIKRGARKAVLQISAILAAAAATLSCSYNETLGRNQLLFVSEGQMAQLASSAWSDIKQKEQITNDPKYVTRVNRVADRIIRAGGGNPAEWEVRVFKSDQLNAFALPGNKIGVYTGIIDLMDNDDQLAAVLGHEKAHVDFNHSGERYSQTAAAQTGLGVAGAAVGGSQTGTAALQALGLGAQVGVLLPFSRKHELEADRFGVRYMHRAGYDANEAIKFWQKMAAQKSGSPPELLSTHPADATRIAALQREIALLK